MEDEPLYRCCGKPFANKFMIQCERCEDWLHGECINMKQAFAKNIESFFCKKCLEKDSTLQVVYTKSYQNQLKRLKKEEDESMAKRCGKCMNCNKVATGVQCNECPRCLRNQPRMCQALHCICPPHLVTKSGRLSKVTENFSYKPTDKKLTTSKNVPKEVPLVPVEKLAEPTNSDPDAPESPRRGGRKRKNDGDSCATPNCPNEARSWSKYCTDDCGRNAARLRLAEMTETQED